jgi:DNA polymerase-1
MHAGSQFNINSPKQLGEVLFDTLNLTAKNLKRTAGGARSTRESELEKMKDEHPIIGEILAYRELQKLLSTYIDPLPRMVDAEGRLHTTFLQAGTTTGRMASQNPNLQNIPIRTEHGRKVRNAFIAAPEHVLVSLDYSQIELRIAAILSGDKKLVEIFKSGQDVHRATAAEVFRVSPEEVDPEMRRRAKVINFGILYGMGVNALRVQLGTSRAEAQEFLNAYFDRFRGLAGYIDSVKQEAYRLGYTETLHGRRRYFEGMRSSLPHVKAAAERMATNAPIQGTQADLIKIAMARVDDWLQENRKLDGAHLILQVHDELVYEMEKDAVKIIVPEIARIMESVLTDAQTHGVPIRADAKVGENWGEMTPLER